MKYWLSRNIAWNVSRKKVIAFEMKVTSENYEQSYRVQINEKVLSTRLPQLCGSDLMPRGKVAFLILLEVELGWVEVIFCMLGIGGASLFSYCSGSGGISVGKVTFLILLGESVGSARFSYCWESGGRSLSRTVGSCRAENQFFHIVGIRWEGHFLILLGVVGHFSHIVGSQVRVEFRMLLRVGGKSRFSYCWKLRPGVESHFSHVGHHTESKLMRNHLSGGKSIFYRHLISQ